MDSRTNRNPQPMAGFQVMVTSAYKPNAYPNVNFTYKYKPLTRNCKFNGHARPLTMTTSSKNMQGVPVPPAASSDNGSTNPAAPVPKAFPVTDMNLISISTSPEDQGVMRRLAYLQRQFTFSQRRDRLLQKAYDECQRITALYAKTFALGTSFLSPEKRTAVWAIYVWCRRTDDLVDGPRVEQRCSSLKDVLAHWEKRLEDVFAGYARDALDLALVDTIRRYPDMDIQPFRDMIAGMLMDVEMSRFSTFEDLYLYCYRVAGTVGLMTLPVMGSADGTPKMLEDAKDAALSLGVALQLTNILRDVGEDRLRGRIYLPLEDLKRFDYTEEDLMNGVLDSRYVALIRFEIERARMYFQRAEDGIGLLSPDARLPVRASLDMYRRILDVIEENEYNNFTKRAYVAKKSKLMMLPVSYFRSMPRDSFIGRIHQLMGSF